MLEAKEAVSLINGTQAMLAVGTLMLLDAEILVDTADVLGAMACDALKGTNVAFDERIQKARAHAGQIKTAANLRRLLEGVRFANRIATAAGCRMHIRCAAFRRCMARCATRSPIVGLCLK